MKRFNAFRLRIEPLEMRTVLDTGAPWTMAMMPDTQYYTERQDWTERYFDTQTQWIRDHVTSDNIKFVSHVGDIVQNGDNNMVEWQRADAAMDKLDGVVPYGVVLGNHDYDTVNDHDSANAYKTYFGSSRYAGQSWYGGSSPDQLNHYQIFEAEGRRYMNITMEWQPRASSVAWVQSVIDAHPDLPTILTTHAYVDLAGHSTQTMGAGYLNGQQIWDQIVSPNPQIFMTLNGHFHGERSQVSTNDANLPVIELLADYQEGTDGGQGYMRLMKFLPQNNRIDVTSYSPALNAYYTDSNSQFSVPLDFDRRLTFTPVATMAGDNSSADSNLQPNAMTVSGGQSFAEIKLSDIDGGIRDASVTSSTVTVLRDGALLSPSTHYTFSYDATADKIRLAPRNGSVAPGNYEIRISAGAAKITDAKGLDMKPQTITVQVQGDTRTQTASTTSSSSSSGPTAQSMQDSSSTTAQPAATPTKSSTQSSDDQSTRESWDAARHNSSANDQAIEEMYAPL